MVLVKVAAAGRECQSWDLKGQTNIVQIAISYSPTFLKSLQFTFLQDDGNLHTSKILGCPNLTGGLFDVITFKGGAEFVTKVEGLWHDGFDFGRIKKLKIHTNVQVYNIFEAEGDLKFYKKFSFKFGGLNQFGGFHGSRNGSEISSIGVYFNQLQALPPNFKRSPATTSLKHEVEG